MERRVGETGHAAVSKLDAVQSQRRRERRRKRSALALGGDEILSAISGCPRNEVRLRAVSFPDLSKEFPAQAQFNGQLRRCLPGVLKVSAVVTPHVVRPGKV